MKNLLIVLALVIFTSCQDNYIILDQTSNISFQLFDENGEGIENTSIKIDSKLYSYYSITDENGVAEFLDFVQGEYFYDIEFNDPTTGMDYYLYKPFMVTAEYDKNFEFHAIDLKKDLTLHVKDQYNNIIANADVSIITGNAFNELFPDTSEIINNTIQTNSANSIGEVVFELVPLNEYNGYRAIVKDLNDKIYFTSNQLYVDRDLDNEYTIRIQVY